MKKRIKIIFIFLISFAIFFSIFSTCKVSATGEIISGADDFIQTGSQGSPIDADNLKNLSDTIYNILLVIGTVLAVIVGMILGIKFVTGSVEQKSKVKETLIPYIIGCIIIFGAFGIWKIVVNIGNSITTDGKTSYEQSSEITDKVISGAKKTSELSDEELKQVFSNNQIARDIGTMINREGKTVEEAVNSLSKYKREIYHECQRRGLLTSNGMGLK